MTNDLNFETQLTEAIESHSPLPRFPRDLTLEDAYARLPEVSAGVANGITAGIKAGITNPEIQALFGLEHALLGQLYDCGRTEAGTSLPYRQQSSIECEIGILIDVNGIPKSFGPALEFVHVDFSQPQDMIPPNLVLSNLGADRFIQGPQHLWRDDLSATLAQTRIRLTRDGRQIMETSVLDSLGGPQAALTWMIEEANRRQLLLADNMLLMTGTCGGGIPFEPGYYMADYGELGSIEFSIDST